LSWCVDSGKSPEGIGVCDASRAEIANLDEMAKRGFAAVGDAFDALRPIRGIVDLHDGIPSVVEIGGRKRISFTQTIDRLGGRLTLHHNVQSGQNRIGERR
jgi:hypothetical protein